jgi:hypothetical protein
MLMLCFAFMLTLLSALARAERPTVEVRLVVTSGGSEFPTRDGQRLRLGAPLVPAPLAIDASAVAAVGAEVRVTLAAPSAQAFAAATAKHRGEKLAIVVDGVVQAAPVLRDAITSGKISITVRSPDEAERLARTLANR